MPVAARAVTPKKPVISSSVSVIHEPWMMGEATNSAKVGSELRREEDWSVTAVSVRDPLDKIDSPGRGDCEAAVEEAAGVANMDFKMFAGVVKRPLK